MNSNQAGSLFALKCENGLYKVRELLREVDDYKHWFVKLEGNIENVEWNGGMIRMNDRMSTDQVISKVTTKVT